MKIRLATADDQPAIIALIDAVLGEYNDSVCLDDAEADLLDIQANFFDRGGAFWVLERETSETTHDELPPTIVGTHAAVADPQQPNVCIFKRLYLSRNLRGAGWGDRLMQNNIDWAIEQQFSRIEFWSDTRFSRAHLFFEKFGFQKNGDIRTMQDSHQEYQEYFFFRDLNL